MEIRKKEKEGLISNLIIIFALGFFIYFIFSAFGGGNGETKAWVLAKHEVETRLKSPSSAKFPAMGSEDVSIREIGERYLISSYVDAQNSFGATVRSKFTVILKKDSNDKYITESVDIK